jgi:hypothetical protein
MIRKVHNRSKATGVNVPITPYALRYPTKTIPYQSMKSRQNPSCAFLACHTVLVCHTVARYRVHVSVGRTL